jgi:hypothetical protein
MVLLDASSACRDNGGDYGSGNGNGKRQKEPPLPGLSIAVAVRIVANLPAS